MYGLHRSLRLRGKVKEGAFDNTQYLSTFILNPNPSLCVDTSIKVDLQSHTQLLQSILCTSTRNLCASLISMMMLLRK